jgi:hypothetical protein
MIKSFLFFTAAILLSFMLSGQEYNRAVGIRGGVTSGVEYRQFFSNSKAGKILLGYRNRGLLIHGIYEVHRSDLFSSANQLSFVYGAGLHAGYQRWDKKRVIGQIVYMDVATGVVGGIDGLLALEYSLSVLPLTLGIEVKPFMDFGGEQGIEAIPWDFAFTVKLSL